MLPPSLRDWLPENIWRYFVRDIIDQVNLSAIEAYLLLRGSVLVATLRKRLQEDVAFRVLAAGNEPDFRTISDFPTKKEAAKRKPENRRRYSGPNGRCGGDSSQNCAAAPYSGTGHEALGHALDTRK